MTDFERTIGRLLIWVTYAATALLAIGVALMLASGIPPLSGGPPLDVESLLGAESLDESMRTSIALRLQGLVARCNGVVEQTDGSTVAEKLESASADEVLDFIDGELGLV